MRPVTAPPRSRSAKAGAGGPAATGATPEADPEVTGETGAQAAARAGAKASVESAAENAAENATENAAGVVGAADATGAATPDLRYAPAPPAGDLPEPPDIVHGVRLAPGVTLLLDQARHAPASGEVAALRTAAEPLLAALAALGLSATGPRLSAATGRAVLLNQSDHAEGMTS
jgi:hypothetical protein